MRRRIVFGFIALFLIVGLFLTPTLLRAIPPRYQARYLPAVLQEIASPKTESAILPTVSSPIDVDALLNTETIQSETVAQQVNTPTHTPPPTFTPVPSQSDETATAIPATSTPLPPTPTPTHTPARYLPLLSASPFLINQEYH